MQDKMPLHTSGLRILLLRFRLHQLLDPLAHQVLHILFSVDLVERPAPQQLRSPRHMQDILRVRAGCHFTQECNIQSGQHTQRMSVFLQQPDLLASHRIADGRRFLVQFLHIGQHLVVLLAPLAGDTPLQLPNLLLTALQEPPLFPILKFQKSLQINCPDRFRDIRYVLFLLFLRSLCGSIRPFRSILSVLLFPVSPMSCVSSRHNYLPFCDRSAEPFPFEYLYGHKIQ